MFTYSPQEKISWIYKNDPVQKFTYTWFLILCCYLNDPQLCFFLFSDSCSWVPCLSWTVKLTTVLQKNPSGPTNSLVFQHFCVFPQYFVKVDETFQTSQSRSSYTIVWKVWMSDLMFNKKNKKNNTTLFTSASHLMVAERWGNKARSFHRMWNKVDSPDFHLCKRWQLELHLHWGAHTRLPLYSQITPDSQQKKTWPWLLKPVGLFLLLWWRFYACYAWGGKNIHFLAQLFTEIDFTLSGMLDKQHLGLQLSAHENYCLQLMWTWCTGLCMCVYTVYIFARKKQLELGWNGLLLSAGV